MKNFTQFSVKLIAVMLWFTGLTALTHAQTNCVTIQPAINHVSCLGESDGYISLELIGGTQPYTIDWGDDPNNHESYRYELIAGTYSVTVTDFTGCITVGTYQVNQPEPGGCYIDIYFHQVSNFELCFQRLFMADIHTGCHPVALEWNFGDGTFAYDTISDNSSTIYPNTYHEYASPGNYQAFLTVTDLNVSGCSQQVSYNVNIPNPVSGTIVQNWLGLSRYMFEVNPTGGSGQYNYTWNINSSYIFGPQVNYVFTQSDWNYFSLTIGDITNPSCQTTIFDSVFVDQVDTCLLFANFNTPSFTMGCNGVSLSVQMSNFSGQTGIQWDFGDGDFALGNYVNHTYIDGVYTYTVHITDTASGCQVVLSDDINISPVVADLNGEIIGQNVDFTLSASGASGQYQVQMVDFGDGSHDYSGKFSFSHTYASSGSFNAYAVVNDKTNYQCIDTAFYTVNISNCSGFSVTLDSIVNASTEVSADGAIFITVNGGTPPYIYMWNNDALIEDLSGISSGNYAVTVSDNNDCEAGGSWFVPFNGSPSCPFTINIIPHQATQGMSDGSIDVYVAGSPSMYAFSIDSGMSWTALDTFMIYTFSSLSPAFYNIGVKDQNNCTVYQQVYVTEAPPCNLEVTHTIGMVTTPGGNNGFVILSVSNGMPPYSFTWNPAVAGTDTIMNLSAGTYTVTISDSYGCITVRQYEITEAGSCPYTINISKTDPTPGFSDGSISIYVTGADSTYYFSLDGGINYIAGGTEYSFFNIPEGTYFISVHDADMCITSQTITLGGAGCSFTITTSYTNPTAGMNDGNITVYLMGSGEHSFYLNGTFYASDTNNIFTFYNLAQGSYVVEVKDIINCTQSAMVTLTSQGGGTCDYTLTYNIQQPTAGNNDGQITIFVNGGMATSYMYIINNTDTLLSGTTANFYNLSQGEYSFKVYDLNNMCLQTLPITLTAGCTFGLYTHVADYTAPDSWDGKIDIWPQIPGNNFTFLWDDGYYPNHRENLGARVYYVTVTDNTTGCYATAALEVKNGPVYYNYNRAYSGCGSFNASITPSGGQPGYNYSWWVESDHFTSPSISYSAFQNKNHLIEVTVSDQVGNTARYFEFIPLLSNTPQIISNNNNGLDFYAEIENIYPADYNITWNMGDGQIWYNAHAVSHHYYAEGTYTVTVDIQNKIYPSCSITISQTVFISSVSCNLTVVPSLTLPDPDVNNGAISLFVSGGTPPYSFYWNNGQSGAQISNLYGGFYYVTIYDNNGCTKYDEIYLPNRQLEDVYIYGEATAYTGLTDEARFERGKVEGINGGPVYRPGMYERFVYLSNATGGFHIAKRINDTTVYLGPLQIENRYIDGSGGQMIGTIQQGIFGENNNIFSVSLSGLYHVVVDLSTNTFCIVPVNTMSLIGPSPEGGSWTTQTPMNLTVNTPDTTIYTITRKLNPGEFKIRYNNGWKVIVDNVMGTPIANPFSFFTNFGGYFDGSYMTLERGGADYYVSTPVSDIYTITVEYTYSAGLLPFVSVFNPCSFSVSAEQYNANVLSSDGSITLNVTGTGPFSYEWNDGSTVQNRSGLASGVYTVSVSDGNCQLVKNYQIGGSWWGANALIIGPSTAFADLWQGNSNMSDFEREGLYQKYLPISSAGGGFRIVLEHYGSTLQFGPVTTESIVIEGDNGYPVNTIRGKLGQNQSMFVVPQNGFYQVVADLQTMTYYIIPVNQIGIVGPATPSGSWSIDTDLLPSGEFSLNNYKFELKNVTLSQGNFKFRNGHMWTYAPDAGFLAPHANNPFWFHTNFGGNLYQSGSMDLIPGGPDFNINIAGIYDIILYWNNYSNLWGETIIKEGFCSYTVMDSIAHPFINMYNGSIHVQAVNATPPVSYQWNDAYWGQDRYNLGPGTYTVVITDGNGCPVTRQYTLIEQNQCGIQYNFDIIPATQGMSDGQITVNITGGTPPFDVFWQYQGMFFGPVLSNIPTGYYHGSIKDGNGCQINFTVHVPSQEPCLTANIDVMMIGCDSVNVNGYTYGTYNGPVFRSWFIDGSPIAQTGPSFSWKFTMGGSHSITLNVSDTSGNCTASSQEIIQIVYPEVANIIVQQNDNRVEFTTNIPNPDNYYYQWYFGDDVYSSKSNPVHYYSQIGTYNVRLYYGFQTNAGCMSYIDDTIVVTNIAPCDLGSTTIGYTLMPNFAARFELLNLQNPEVSIGWYIDGQYVSSNSNFTYGFNGYGTHHVCATIHAYYDTACHINLCQDVFIDSLSCNFALSTQSMDQGLIINAINAAYPWNLEIYGPQGYYVNYNAITDPNIYINHLGPIGLYSFYAYDNIGCQYSTDYYFRPGGNGSNIDFVINTYGYCPPAYVNIYNTSFINPAVGPVTYTWNIDGIIYNGDAVNDSFYGGHHTVTLIVTDIYNQIVGQVTKSFDIEGYSGNLVTNFGTEACPGSVVKFYCNDQHYNVIWTIQNLGVTGQGSGYGYRFDNPGVYTITAQVITNCGTYNDTLVITVTPDATPVAQINTEGNHGCPGDKMQFHAYEGFTSYYWQFGDGDVAYTRDAQHQYANFGQYVVTLTVTNSCGKSASATTTIFIEQGMQPYAEFGYPYYTVCPNTPVQFYAWGIGNYFWNFGDGQMSLERNPVHYYSNPGMYPVNLQITNGCGRSAEVVHYVYVDYTGGGVPDARFDISDRLEDLDSITVCPGFTAFFRNRTNYYTDVQTSWLINGRQVSTSYNLNYTFDQPGFYQVTLRVGSACAGIYNETSKYVNVSTSAVPYVRLNFMPDTICPGEKVLVWDEYYGALGNYSYDVDFGDGTLLTGLTNRIEPFDDLAEHIYNNTGIYNYTITAHNSCGNSYTKNGQLVVDNTGNHQSFYYIGNSTASDDPLYGKAIYISPTDSTFTQFYYIATDATNVGTYQIGLALGPNDKNPVIIAEGAYSYDSVTNTITFYNPTRGCTQPANYGIGFTNQNMYFTLISDGCTSRVNAITGRVFMMVQEPDDWEGPKPACPGDPVAFYFFGGVSYNWNFGDGSGGSNLQNPLHTYTLPGTYNAHVVVTNGCGQIDTLYTQVRVSEDAYPEANFGTMVDDNSIYVGDQIEFHAEKDRNDIAIVYSWYVDEVFIGNSDNIFYVFNTPGYHYVRLDAQNGCGTNSHTRDFYVRQQEVVTCAAGFIYYIEPGTKNVQFMAQTTGNINTYNWYFGDNFTSTLQNPTHNFANAGYYNVCLTVSDNTIGCVNQYCQVIQIIDTTASCRAYFTFIAEGLNVQFNNKSTTGNYIYQWSFGDGTGSNQMSPTHLYSYPGVYNVCLVIKGTPGSATANCFDTYCYQVQVTGSATCFADFTYSITNKTVTFTNLSTGATNYQWNFGAGPSSGSTAVNPTYTYSTGGYYDVCLNILNNNTGCQASICKQIYIVDTTAVICRSKFSYVIMHDTVAFINQSEGQNLSYYWDFGNGITSNQANPTHIYSATGYYNVCLTVYNATGCNNQSCMTIYVIKDETVSCQANFTYFVSGSNVHFTSTSLGQVTNLLWNFGDGTYSTSANPVHTYSVPNFYNVCLTVYNDANGCMHQKCSMVMAIDTATVILNANFSYVANSLTAYFTNTSQGSPTNYLWNFGDGTYSTLQNPSHVFPQTGYYNVCLTVYDAVHGLLNNKCALVMVFDTTPQIPLNANFNYFISNTNVTFSNTSTGNITNYLWDFGDGSYAFTANTSHKYNGTNYYNVCLTVYDNVSGKLSKKCQSILVIDSVGTACKANFAYITTGVGTTVNFTAQPQGNITNYFWDFGDGTYAYTANPSHTYAVPDFYQVCLKVFDNVSGCMNTNCQYVVIIDSTADMCNADFTAITSNKNAYFTSTSQGNITNYFWDFGDGSYAYIADPSHTYQRPNYYNVKLSIYDNVSGCMDDKYQYVVIIDSTAFLCKSDFDYYVNNKVASFTSTSLGNISNYFWDFGDGTYAYIANPTHTYNYPGIYDVFLTVYDNATGCMNTKDKWVVVVDSTAFLCNASFTYNAQNLNVVFSNTSTGNPDIFFWNLGDGTYKYTANATHTYAEPGYYNVYLSIYNSANGCLDDYSNIVVVTTPQATGLCNARFTYYPQGNAISFQNAAVGAFSQLFWDFDDGFNSNQSNPVHTFSNPGYYNVCLTVIDTTTGCFDTRCQVVYVQGQNQVVKANFSYLPVADSLKVKFNDLSYGNPDMWYWDFGDNTQASFEQNPIHYYSVNDYYRVCLTVQNPISQNMKCEFIAVGDVSNSVTAYFTYFADSVTSTGHFKNMSLGNIASYYWSFGDGYYSQQKNPSHTYQDTGYYAVCLTVTGVSGQIRTFCQDVRIGNALANPCLFSCVWPGDANNDLEANHYDIMTLGLNYGMTGPRRENASNNWYGQFAPNWSTYQINGVNNKHGDCNGDGIINMDDTLAINLNFAYSHYFQPDVLKNNDWEINCEWLPITPKATSRKAAAKLTPPSGKPAGDIYAIAYEIKVVNAAGINFNGVTVSFNNSWMGTPGVNLINIVNVNAALQTVYIGSARTDHTNITGSGDIAEITFPLLAGYDGSQTTFVVTTLGGIIATGNPVGIGQGFNIELGPDVDICQGQSVQLALPNIYDAYLWTGGSTDTAITVTQSGKYFVTVTNNGIQRVDSVIVNVHNLPAIELGDNTGFCSGSSYTINAGSGMTSYLWSTADTTQTITVNTAGNYSVTVTNEFGCHNTDAVTLEVYPLPVIDLGETVQLCQGETTTLTPGAGFVNYLWSSSETTSSIVTGTAGTYSVTVTDAHQCQNSDAVDVIVYELPVVNLGNDFSQADSAIINAGAGFVHYLWNTNDTTQTITVFQTGTYWVVVTDANGCQGTDTISVTITGLPSLMAIDKLKLYPNPARDRFIVDLSTRVYGHTIVELYNGQGQLVLKREWLNTASFRSEIDMEKAAKGIYNLIITKGNAKVSRKIVIE